MNQTSLRIGFDAQNYSYLTHILSKENIKPNQKYLLSPCYLKYWAMTEAGKLLNESVDQWEQLLNKEITRLEDTKKVLAELERQRAEDDERLRADPGYRALMVAKTNIIAA
jgi:hypothetical protein